MRQLHTSVLEPGTTIADGYATEPHECAWASQAIFFISADEPWPRDLEAVVQLSPDGVHWIDDGEPRGLGGESRAFLRVTHFGGWLRLRFQGNGKVFGTIRLALKS